MKTYQKIKKKYSDIRIWLHNKFKNQILKKWEDKNIPEKVETLKNELTRLNNMIEDLAKAGAKLTENVSNELTRLDDMLEVKLNKLIDDDNQKQKDDDWWRGKSD